MRKLYRLKSMGADDYNAQAEFDSQLLGFRNTLITLYRKKTKIVSERESLRFQYLTGLKTKFSNVVSAIYSATFQTGSGELQDLIRAILMNIQSGIPMTSMNGQPIDGWRGQLQSVGGRLGVGYLSPSNHILAERFYSTAESEDARPAYQLYTTVFRDYGVDILLNNWFLLQQKSGWLNGAQIPFTIPPSQEWVEVLAGQQPAAQNKTAFVEQMQTILSSTYNGTTLSQVVSQMEDILYKILMNTVEMVRIQIEIDGVESQLSQFVDSYKDVLADPLSLAQILDQIHSAADQADIVPTSDVQNNVSAVSTSVDASAANSNPADPLPEQKSNLMLYAAAAAGIFLLTRK